LTLKLILSSAGVPSSAVASSPSSLAAASLSFRMSALLLPHVSHFHSPLVSAMALRWSSPHSIAPT